MLLHAGLSHVMYPCSNWSHILLLLDKFPWTRWAHIPLVTRQLHKGKLANYLLYSKNTKLMWISISLLDRAHKNVALKVTA